MLGESDCEQVRDAVLAQPVASLTSLGYAVAGGWLLWRWRGLPSRQRWTAGAYAGMLVAVGAGSFVYHGTQGAGAELLHDLPIALVLVEAAAVPVARLVSRRPVLRRDSRRTLLTMAGLSVVAGLAYALGRTGGPLCDPRSFLQAHGLWHLCGAAVLALWATVLWPAPTPSAPRSEA